MRLSDDYALQYNWSDMKACLEKKPLPVIYLYKLFGKDEGPNGYPKLVGKAKQLHDSVERLHTDWEKTDGRGFDSISGFPRCQELRG